MNTKTIIPPNFMGRTANIIAEIRTRTGIDDVDVEVLEGILQDALNEYYSMVDEYYEEEYYIAISSARNSAYDDGYDDGYDIGYDNGYSDSHSAV